MQKLSNPRETANVFTYPSSTHSLSDLDSFESHALRNGIKPNTASQNGSLKPLRIELNRQSSETDRWKIKTERMEKMLFSHMTPQNINGKPKADLRHSEIFVDKAVPQFGSSSAMRLPMRNSVDFDNGMSTQKKRFSLYSDWSHEQKGASEDAITSELKYQRDSQIQRPIRLQVRVK